MAQYGPHRYSAGDLGPEHTDAFRAADFSVVDLSGKRFVDCDLSGATIVDSVLVDVDVSGYVDHFVINGVDVTAFVDAELDRRHPERVQLRQVRDADGFRAMWETVERIWADATARAERLPEPARSDRVDGEWSFAETLRHLVFITDAWVRRTVLDEPMPYDRIGVVQSWYPPADAANARHRPRRATVVRRRAAGTGRPDVAAAPDRRRPHRRRARPDVPTLARPRLSR